jgi:hypothetical protein
MFAMAEGISPDWSAMPKEDKRVWRWREMNTYLQYIFRGQPEYFDNNIDQGMTTLDCCTVKVVGVMPEQAATESGCVSYRYFLLSQS